LGAGAALFGAALSSKLYKHMAQNLRCPECGYEAKDENDKREHMKRQHQNAGGGSAGEQTPANE